MDKKTSEVLRKISASVSKKDIDNAYREVVTDRSSMREHAKYLLEMTTRSTGNQWNSRQNETMRKMMTTALNDGSLDDLKTTETDQRVVSKLDKTLDARVQSAIKSGRILKPTARDFKLKK